MSNCQKKYKTLKKILHAGKGSVPKFDIDTKATFDYEVLMPLVEVINVNSFPDNFECYKSIDNTKKIWPDGYGKPLELIIGKKFQLSVLEACVSTMLVNEISRFDIEKTELYAYPTISKRLRDISRSTLDKNFDLNKRNHNCAVNGPIKTGYKILDELIEKPRALRFIIHLKEVLQPNQYCIETWQLNAIQRLKILDTYRKEGNNFFMQKKYDEASIKYKEALGIIENLLLQEKPGDAEWVELDKKNIPFYLNLCQCFLKQSMYYEAAQTATEVLKRDKYNEKGLFRRGKARIGSWDLDLAEEDFKLLLKCYPNLSKIVNEQLMLILTKRKEEKKNTCISYKSMFKAFS